MLLPIIEELKIYGVYDPGVSGMEKIVLRPYSTVQLGYYALTIGIKERGNYATPFFDHYLWLGEHILQPPSWLFVFTGTGSGPRTDKEKFTGDPIHVLYWNKSHVLFNNPEIVPVLIRLDGINIGQNEEVSIPREWVTHHQLELLESDQTTNKT